MLPNINLLKVKKRSKLHHQWFQVAERLLHLLVIFGRSSGFDRKIFGIYCFRRIRHKFWSLYYRFNVMKPYIAGRDSSKQGCPWGESSVVVNRSFHSCVLRDRFFFFFGNSQCFFNHTYSCFIGVATKQAGLKYCSNNNKKMLMASSWWIVDSASRFWERTTYLFRLLEQITTGASQISDFLALELQLIIVRARSI